MAQHSRTTEPNVDDESTLGRLSGRASRISREIAERLSAALGRAEATSRDLARAMDVHEKTAANYLSGRRPMMAAHVPLAAECLGVQASEILTGARSVGAG